MLASDLEPITHFLQTHFHPRANHLQFMGAGWFSHAYQFVVGDERFVVRLNAWAEDFRKDAFACQHFAAPELPIPEMMACDRYDEARYFAITRHCLGQTVSELPRSALAPALPSLFAALQAIHRLDVSTFTGWGLTDSAFNGRFPSWPAYLLALYNQKFAYTLDSLAATTFLEKAFFEEMLHHVTDLLPYLPSEKYLVHGDYGFENVVVNGRSVSGVLDWAEARLGDFLYDIANLGFWETAYIPAWRDFATAQGIPLPYFAERIRCYWLVIGLGSMMIPASKNNHTEYLRFKARTLQILNPQQEPLC